MFWYWIVAEINEEKPTIETKTAHIFLSYFLVMFCLKGKLKFLQSGRRLWLGCQHITTQKEETDQVYFAPKCFSRRQKLNIPCLVMIGKKEMDEFWFLFVFFVTHLRYENFDTLFPCFISTIYFRSFKYSNKNTIFGEQDITITIKYMYDYIST